MKSDVNLFFMITNRYIVCSHSLPCCINYKFLCLGTYWQWKLAHVGARISTVIILSGMGYVHNFKQELAWWSKVKPIFMPGSWNLPFVLTMKWQTVFPLLPWGDTSPVEGHPCPSIKFADAHLYSWLKRGTVRAWWNVLPPVCRTGLESALLDHEFSECTKGKICVPVLEIKEV